MFQNHDAGPPAPNEPAFAAKFLNDVATRAATERSYQTALRRLQAFAVDQGYTEQDTPLPPDAIHATFLAEFYSWLKDQKKDVRDKRGRKKQAARYRDESIRLYLAAARRYIGWLEGGDLLPQEVSTPRMAARLAQRLPARGLTRARRGANPAAGKLLFYYRDKLAEVEAEYRSKGRPTPRQTRLLLLRNQALTLTLYATACRESELAALQRADVAEGNADWVRIPAGKGHADRFVVLDEPSKRAIKAYLRERADTHAGLFISHGAHSGGMITPRTVWYVVSQAAKDRLGASLGPHALRHLRAQDLSDEGMEPKALAAYLGHSDTRVTELYYAPKTPQEKIADQIQTYGRKPEEAARRAEQD